MARRRIRVADFRGEPVELELSDGTVYRIRGDMPMEVVTYLSDFEERGDEADDFDKWLEEGRLLLQSIVREGGEDQRAAVLPQLSPQELLGIMGSMLGGESVGAALAAALNDGVGEALRAKAEAEKDPPTPRPRTPKRSTAKRSTAKRATAKKTTARRSTKR